MSMKFINPEFQVSKSKNKKVIKVCFGTRSSGTPCKSKKYRLKFQVQSFNFHVLLCKFQSTKELLINCKMWQKL